MVRNMALEPTERVRVCVQGRWLDLLVDDRVQPSGFSLFLANMLAPHSSDRIAVDAGAGGGILAITLAQLGLQKTYAVEVSDHACAVLEANAWRNNVADRVEIINADVAHCDIGDNVDLVVANPPTLPFRDGLPAFFSGGGPDGTAFLRSLAGASTRWLARGGQLQLVLSSLLGADPFRWLETPRPFEVKPVGTLLYPFRDFYELVYDAKAVRSLAAAGDVILLALRGGS